MLNKVFALILVGVGFLAFNHEVLALTLDTGLIEAGTEASYSNANTLESTVGLLIKVVIGLLGVVFLILTLFAGITWMTAAGDSKKVDSAKSTLGSAVIGLIICLSAFAITSFVINEIQATQQADVGAPL